MSLFDNSYPLNDVLDDAILLAFKEAISYDDISVMLFLEALNNSKGGKQ